MEKIYLQEYLNLQFLPNLEEDESHKKLVQASGLVLNHLNSNPAQVIPFTLAAFDPNVQETDLAIAEVKRIITDKWPTFPSKVSKNNDTPTSYMRAVMVDALSKVYKVGEMSSLIWKTCQDPIRYFSLDREAELINGLVSSIANNAESNAVSQWSIIENFEIPAFPELKIKKPEGDLTVDIAVTNIDSSVNKHYVNLRKQLEQTSNDILSKSKAIDLRTRLLWWKQCAYSESLKRSYRQMNSLELLFALAKDYAEIIPSASPVSVDFFLTEFYSELNQDAKTKIKLSTFLGQVYSAKTSLTSLVIPTPPDVMGRNSLGYFISKLVNGVSQEENCRPETGISLETELTWEELLLWLFHSNQLQKHITQLKK